MPQAVTAPQGYATTLGRRADVEQIMRQIGAVNVLAISGGRWRVVRNDDNDSVGVRLPVSNGYSVEIVLAPNDTYTVRRVFQRSGRQWVHWEASDVYADQLADTAWEASCFRTTPGNV